MIVTNGIIIMNLDFPLILVLLTLGSGLIWLLDLLYLRRNRAQGHDEVKEPMLVEMARGFFPVFLVVLLLRSFVLEPFRIPSGSMMPTLLIGDFILVNKFAYGLRLPVLETKVVEIGDPQRGDVAVFRFPNNPSIDYIKRVVGVPGDRIDYRKKTLYINDQPVVLQEAGMFRGDGASERFTGFLAYNENLTGVEHDIMIHPLAPNFVPGCRVLMDGPITVPEGHYFAMGDNRDNSNDSRCWGLVPDANLRGRAMAIWMNWDSERSGFVDWSRIGRGIK